MAQVHVSDRDGVRVLTLDNAPVNALSFVFSAILLSAVQTAESDAAVQAVVITGANGIFSGGADVNDFSTEPTAETKTIRDVLIAIDASKKPYAVAIDGNALGGGLELALTCDYRLATPKSKVGLPEIKLGLLPGAGGTQRLPRLIGAQAALEFMLKGSTHAAEKAKTLGVIDEVVDGDVVDAAIVYLLAHPAKRRISSMKPWIAKGIPNNAAPFIVAQAHKMVPKERSGGFAAHKLIDAVEAAVTMPFAFGIAREARLFEELVRSAPSAALRHIFFAERELAKIPGLPAAEPLEIKKAAVIGAGTMGSGIAITFAQAGIPSVVIDSNYDAVEKAKQTVFGMFMYQVQKGKLTQEQAWKLGQSITFTDDYAALEDADVVIEAVFESMDVKKQVFSKLDDLCKPSCLLASNTSTLDIDEIANSTTRPEQVIGLHFFAPANVMQLLEVVRGSKTSDVTIVTSMALSKKLKKKGVLSGNAFGFIGNRMLFDYIREATFLLEEGATPSQVDKAIRDFGFPMGPFAMSDLSGIDVFYKISQEAPKSDYRTSEIAIRLYEKGRYGQKTGSGFFTYVAGDRKPVRDPEAEAVIALESERLGIARRTDITDAEIVERCMYALINQGAQLLGDGIALRPGDEDIAWIYGYGFPWYRGGPMWLADTIGPKKIYDQIMTWQRTLGKHWQPAPHLQKIAEENGTFAPRPTIGATN